MFVEAASEHIKQLEYGLSQPVTPQTIQDMHLHAHSLKGECFLMQYTALGEYIKVLEVFLKAKTVLTTQEKKNVNEAILCIKRQIAEVQAKKQNNVLTDEIEKLQEKLGVAIT